MSCFDDGGMYAPADLMDSLTESLHKTFDFDRSINQSKTFNQSNNQTCDCSHQIQSLQNDLFVLRQIFDSELSKAKFEMERSVSQTINQTVNQLFEAKMKEFKQSINQTINQTVNQTVEHAVNQSISQSLNQSTYPSPASKSPVLSEQSINQSIWSDHDCGNEYLINPSVNQSNKQTIIDSEYHYNNQIINQSISQSNKQSVTQPITLPVNSVPVYNQTINQSMNQSNQSINFNQSINQLPPCTTPGALSKLSNLINPSGGPLNESTLIHLSIKILTDHGSIPVGKMGSLLHKLANDQFLPNFLKEKYGGLKKFLGNFNHLFLVAEDHPYNPHVCLINQTINQSINQTINQTINHTNSQIIYDQTIDELDVLDPYYDQPIPSSITQAIPITRSNKQSINQSINQSNNQSINQIVKTTKPIGLFDSPFSSTSTTYESWPVSG